MYVGSPTVSWTAIGDHLIEQNLLSFLPSHQLSITSPCRGGNLWVPPWSIVNSTWLVLVPAMTNHPCHEFMCSTAFLCPEKFSFFLLALTGFENLLIPSTLSLGCRVGDVSVTLYHLNASWALIFFIKTLCESLY